MPAVEVAHPDLRVLHIADCSAYQLKQLGIGQVGLVGTQPTMEESYLHDRLALHGITTVIPDEASVREEIYRIIYEELSQLVSKPAFWDAPRSSYWLSSRTCQNLYCSLRPRSTFSSLPTFF